MVPVGAAAARGMVRAVGTDVREGLLDIPVIPGAWGAAAENRPRTTMSSLGRLPQAIAVAAALAATACSGIVTGGIGGDDDGDGDGDMDGDGEPDDGDPIEPDSFETAPPPLALPAGAIDSVGARIRGLVDAAPFAHSVLVENRTTGQVIAEANPDRMSTPASNTKLYTTAAAMEILGEDHGLTTRVFAAAPIGAGGAVSGDLHIILEHDFSLSSDIYDGPRQPLDRLAGALKAAGLTSVGGTVRVSGESVYEANSIGYLDLAAERAQTTDAMAGALAAAGISVGGVAGSTALEPPAGSVAILERAPITLAVGVSPLMTDSNNEFADLLIRHIGWSVDGTSSAAAGTGAVIDWLASAGIPTDGISLNDGSGLSHSNKVSARSTVSLLRFMEGTPVGETWLNTFAIAGVRGTLGGRMTGGDTVGRVFGKTGSLSDTIALSGRLENRHDGQRYYFSVLLNQAGIDQTRARALGDDIVESFAGNLRQSGPRPATPALRFARGTGTPGVLDIGWTEVGGADGYLVWLSEDGRVWSRDAARYVHGARFKAGDLSADRPTFVRVTARGADGLESDPSATYAGTAGDDGTEVLLVDGNDRWADSAENTLGRTHDFAARVAASTGARRLATVHHGAIEDGSAELGEVPTVMWLLGEESTMTVALSAEERGALEAYVEAGGLLVLSGSEVVWALADQGTADEKAFAADVLGAGLSNDDAGTYEVVGAAGSPLAGVPWSSFYAPDGMDIMFPDVLTPGAGAQAILRYVGGTGGAAAIATTGPRHVVVTGFPIEAVPSAAARATIIDAALSSVD
jgi:D-alanyl-D-alanine carboxypeptidase